MEKVLIFGIGGFVGSYLAKEFIEHDYIVSGADKVKGQMLPDGVSFQEIDLLDSHAVLALVENECPDIVVNLAAISSVGQSWNLPQTTVMINVVGALNILEAVRKSNKKSKIMFIGSSEEYVISNEPLSEKNDLDASNPYGISKVTQERFAKLYRDQFGLKVYCVRPFNHTGIGQRDSFVLSSWCKQVAEIEKSGKPGVIKVGNLNVKRDFSHVKDIVRAYRMIVESDNCDRVYNVGSGVSYSLKDILDYILGLSTQTIEVSIDRDLMRPSDQALICCNHDLITRELGWVPEHTVFDALKEMYFNYLKVDL